MACSSCAKRRAMAINNQPSLTMQRNQQLTQGNFLQLHYIGEDNAIIPTTLSHVGYGYRKYGELMYVAVVDYEAFEGVWVTQDEFSTINS